MPHAQTAPCRSIPGVVDVDPKLASRMQAREVYFCLLRLPKSNPGLLSRSGL